MAYINFYYINEAVYSPEDKTISIFGEMDITREIFALMEEGLLEDFTTCRNQVYRFDLTNIAELKYCIRWIDSQLDEKDRGLKITEKLKKLQGRKYPKVLVDNETVRQSYNQYVKDHQNSQKKGKSKK